MYYKCEKELVNFNFWGGAKAVVARMTIEEIDAIDQWLEDSYGENVPDETEINDFFWFDDDCWLEIINETEETFYERPLATENGYKFWPDKETMKKGA